MDVKDKVAYITGGSKGIGLGIAKCLLEAGMKVAISGRNEKALEEAAATLNHPDNLFTVVSDVTELEQEQVSRAKSFEPLGSIRCCFS